MAKSHRHWVQYEHLFQMLNVGALVPQLHALREVEAANRHFLACVQDFAPTLGEVGRFRWEMSKKLTAYISGQEAALQAIAQTMQIPGREGALMMIGLRSRIAAAESLRIALGLVDIVHPFKGMHSTYRSCACFLQETIREIELERVRREAQFGMVQTRHTNGLDANHIKEWAWWRSAYLPGPLGRCLGRPESKAAEA